jgi:hypothetical protein
MCLSSVLLMGIKIDLECIDDFDVAEESWMLDGLPSSYSHQ